MDLFSTVDKFLLIKKEILEERSFGVVHCELIENSCEDIRKSLMKIAQYMNFEILDYSLELIERNKAIEIATLILNKELAYSTIQAPIEIASKLSANFCDLFVGNAKFFTNLEFKDSSIMSWNSVTKATFDVGIIIVDRNYIGCLWVEDED